MIIYIYSYSDVSYRRNKELLDYIYENYDEIECELNGDEYKESKHNRNFCINCNLEMTIDYQKST